MSSQHATTPSSDNIARPKPVFPIMIVDDDLAVLEMLRVMVHEQGFPVVLANNAVAVQYLVQRTLASFVITDFMLGDISGLDLADQLRHDSRTAEIPVIVMSTFTLPAAGTRVAAVIRKPFAFDELLRLVHHFWFQ